ncbi:hypothetical protein LINPERPRIM_LOCUS27773 [Linum perenne]
MDIILGVALPRGASKL